VTDPAAAFRAVSATHPRCFWLDGGGAREWSGRRSIVGWLEDDDVSLTYDAARREVRRHAGGTSVVVGDDIWAVLEESMGPGEQWFGYLGAACRPDLPARPDPELPDAVWMRPSSVRSFEHAVVGAPPSLRSPLQRGSPRLLADATASNRQGRPVGGAPEAYAAAFARVQEHLRAGNSYEVNLTYRLAAEADPDPVATYLRLRELNPAPYAGCLQHDVEGHRAWLLSSSPERYALVTADRTIETKPIKGTAPRGDTAEEDAALRDGLARDPKNRAENLMIVDLLRNDIGMVSEVGSVEVPVLMDVESYESVHQLVSTVRGRLRDDVTTVGALRALFPPGSMTGAPKRRTMEVIEEVEETPRGVYAGAFGWISGDGPADLGVVIRSLTTAGDGRWTLGTGGGITVRSDAEDEWLESRWKAERLLRALAPDG
jgi:para-aminobenzoate synthetase